MRSRTQAGYTIALLAAVLATACNPDRIVTTPESSGSMETPVYSAGGVSDARQDAARDAVLAGNAMAIAEAPALFPPGAPVAPFVEARMFAIADVAMHDALNSIVPRFERYADTGPIDRNADLAAAVLTAAHDAIVGAAPASSSEVDAWYAGAIAAAAGNPGFDEGVSIGHRAALAILELRASDGTAGGGVAPYTPGSDPGDYRFTFPFDTPGFDIFGTGGFADGTIWGATVTPFVVPSTSRFRAPRPYAAVSNSAAVLTRRYTDDFDEVKRLGCSGCTERTAEQTEIALFWVEQSPEMFNRVGRVIAGQRKLDAWATARLLALLQMGEFDSYATNLESKYYYNFWRPVTAVALADGDGNAETSSAPGWEVLAFPTPPIPDYPSAHSSAGGTAAAIIEGAVPGRGAKFSITSTSLPGVTRTFSDVAEAASENAMSRVYVGYHFRLATEVGLAQGRGVGDYVVRNALRPIHDQ
ncbi:MAG TPA: vanadium-dependent haloperoxidase [Gemmatimonadaceae bacterium]|nr:vanadium-dependent haloperoxidase [Gemmatimonadaceae bacterium]